MGIKQRKTAIIFVLIYLVTLFIRFYRLSDVLVYVDEVTWMVKGKEAVYALKNLNLDYFRNAWWESKTDSYAISWPLAVMSGISHVTLAGTGKYSFHLLDDVTASRLPVILIGSITAPAIFYYGISLVGFYPALFAALCYSLNPIAIALDRWLLNDSYLSIFSFLAISSYIFDQSKSRRNLLPGVWLSLAFLTKPNGVLCAIPWLISILFGSGKREKFFYLVKNILVFLVVTTIVWPKSWFSPIIAVPEYLLNQLNLVNLGDPIHNFYLGVSSTSPHWSYYLFQLATRTPEIIIFGILLGILRMVYTRKRPTAEACSILIYLLVSLILLSSSAVKGGVRYVLFFYPWLFLFASYHIYRLILVVSKPAKFFLILIVLVLTIHPLLYFPQNYLYYNALVGGASGGVKYDLVGLCFGNRLALEYLDKKQLVGLTAILGCPDSGLYHSSRPQTKNILVAKYIILESAYIQQFPKDPKISQVQKLRLLATVYEKNLVTARIYARP